MRILQKYPLFLILLPAFVVIHLEKELQGLIHYHFVWDRILILFAIPILLFLLFFLLVRSWSNAAVLSLTTSFLFFFLGDLKNWISLKFPDSIFQKYAFLFTAGLVLLGLLFFYLKKKKPELKPVFSLFNIGLLLFIGADLFQMVMSHSGGRYRMHPVELGTDTAIPDSTKPDIYYLIFDAYASGNRLREEFNYDNSSHENVLRDKGFHIIPQSRSNYNYTAFSISSVFNMHYMANPDTAGKLHDREYLQALRTVYDNKLFPFLEKQGYEIHNHSLFDIRGYPTTRTRSDKWGIRELFDQYNILFKFLRENNHRLPNWVTKAAVDDPFFVNSAENRTFYDESVKKDLFQSLAKKNKAPQFIYAHFLTPHPPFYLDSTGNPFPKGMTDRSEGYRHQIARINHTMTEVVDSLLASKTRPLIIIIQGDHGYTLTEVGYGKRRAMFQNLHAWYSSTGEYQKLGDSLTNVNSFRILLNTWFKKELPILQDEFFFLK